MTLKHPKFWFRFLKFTSFEFYLLHFTLELFIAHLNVLHDFEIGDFDLVLQGQLDFKLS